MNKALVALENRYIKEQEKECAIIVYGGYKRKDLKNLKNFFIRENLKTLFLSKRGLKSLNLFSSSNLYLISGFKEEKTLKILELLEKEGFEILLIQAKQRIMTYLEFKEGNFLRMDHSSILMFFLSLLMSSLLSLYTLNLQIVWLIESIGNGDIKSVIKV